MSKKESYGFYRRQLLHIDVIIVESRKFLVNFESFSEHQHTAIDQSLADMTLSTDAQAVDAVIDAVMGKIGRAHV